MVIGTVRFWNASRGFGFLQRDDGAEDVFCHITRVTAGVDELRIGDRVQFEPGINPRNGKIEAQNVALID